MNPFDPLLDRNCERLPVPAAASWKARWIWYPGQLAAHLHARLVRQSLDRCVSVGYPGTFAKTESRVHLRLTLVVAEQVSFRWRVPLGRTRFFVNGSELALTQRDWSEGPGKMELRAVVDSSSGLPCLLLEGNGVATGESWEASLDGVEWVPVECEAGAGSPDLPPDAPRETGVRIPAHQAILNHEMVANPRHIELGAGEECILDFRHNEIGSFCMDAVGEGDLVVTVGESVQEASNDDPAFFEQHPLPVVRLGAEQHVRMPERGLRFVKLRTSGRCRLRNISFEAQVTPVEFPGEFECDDPEINAIWNAAVATLHANAHGFYLDGIKRDALIWGDMLTEVEAGDCVFFDRLTARQSIVAMTLPPGAEAGDIGLIDHRLLPILGYEHDFMMTGDKGFVRAYLPRIRGTLDLFASLQDEHGFISALRCQSRDWGFYSDWTMVEPHGPDRWGTPSYAQILLMRAFESGAFLEGQCGTEYRSLKYRQLAERLRAGIRELFWDGSKGAFINGFLTDGSIDRRYSTHAQVWGILSDLIAPAEYDRVYEAVLANPAHRAPNLSIAHHWEFLADTKAGKMPQSLGTLRRVWGKMLADGYTRFFEDIRPGDTALESLAFYGRPYANSLCHGWAGAAPVIALSRGVMGISPRAPGYERCRVAPQLGGLNWIRGTVPTPHGIIRLEFSREKGGTLVLPRGVTADIVNPLVQVSSGMAEMARLSILTAS